MAHKLFAERLNKELDSISVPSQALERVDAFAKLIKIPKFKAEAFLNGISIPDEELLNRIAKELEVSADWLLGKADAQKHC